MRRLRNITRLVAGQCVVPRVTVLAYRYAYCTQLHAATHQRRSQTHRHRHRHTHSRAQRQQRNTHAGTHLQGPPEVIERLVVAREGLNEAAQLVRFQRLLQARVATASSVIFVIRLPTHAAELLHVLQPREARLTVLHHLVHDWTVVHAQRGEHRVVAVPTASCERTARATRCTRHALPHTWSNRSLRGEG